MRPIKVVSVQTSNERGGGEYAGVGLLALLGEAGIEVELLTNDASVAAGTDVTAREISIGPKLSRRTLRRVAGGFLPWLLRLALELRRSAPYDVLLAHYKKEQLMSALLPRRVAPAVVWAEWGPLPFEFRRGAPRLAYRLAARRVAAILAVSEGTRDSLVDVGVPAEKIKVVPSAIDPGTIAFDADARTRYRQQWGVRDGGFVIGLVARLSPAKRNDVVVDSLAFLGDDVTLVIAGSGSEEPSLRDRAARYGDRVLFLPTPRGYVQEVLSACDVAVFAPHVTEGAPRAIAFGHLVGRPVVATAANGTDELVPGTGTVVSPPHDAAALAEALAAYRSDPERREREGSLGRELAAARYDRQRARETLAGVFHGVA